MAYPPEISRIDANRLKNTQEHRTNSIRGRDLFLRRGQPFIITLSFYHRRQEETLENLSLTAKTGPNPSKQAGTLIKIPVTGLRDTTWSAAAESQSITSLILTICTSVNASIGRYHLSLEGTYWGRTRSYYLGEFVLLFNPWCPDDDVFLDDEEMRQEYVMNEHGLLFQGSKDFIATIPWNFGQFEDGVGEICLRILDMSPNYLKNPSLDCSRRGNPVYVSRVISAMINSNDDRGVIESCWGEFFDNGANPSTWNGSVTILRMWHNTGCRPVRYGQCWVLAGVMCTVMRLLGIPTRVVTNFESAHDTNFSLTVDEYYDETGKKLNPAKGDSIWNFHVWDECWMTRKDLRPGYDGWQVLDPTPQEISGGTFCCGPAPVKAVKEGDVDVDYDVAFVFAEVNGDVVHWVFRDGEVEKGQVDGLTIGKFISTKGVGNNNREDITNHYKYGDGSAQERAVFEKAVDKLKSKKPSMDKDSVVALDFNTSLKLAQSPLIGQTIILLYRIHNKSIEHKSFSISVSAQEMMYNGTALEQFWVETFEIDVRAGRDIQSSFQIHASHYQPFVRPGNNIRVTALTTDLKNKKLKLASKNIVFEAPEITIELLGTPQLNHPLTVLLSIANPLNEILNNCVVTAEGTGLFPNGSARVQMDQIFPGRNGIVRLFCVPFKTGKLQLEVNFSCNQLKYIKGSLIIEVP
ncbi:protein-glutamine gamma-glutamyltransferase 5-like [Eleutherodactylus coqui]|uniref:protein-glutamine gamma-glutamyltransferase 5-like n=1 Tax=Eleutherodactylus coqui TaxID=57060 RepID=UPI00346313AC